MDSKDIYLINELKESTSSLKKRITNNLYGTSVIYENDFLSPLLLSVPAVILLMTKGIIKQNFKFSNKESLNLFFIEKGSLTVTQKGKQQEVFDNALIISKNTYQLTFENRGNTDVAFTYISLKGTLIKCFFDILCDNESDFYVIDNHIDFISVKEKLLLYLNESSESNLIEIHSILSDTFTDIYRKNKKRTENMPKWLINTIASINSHPKNYIDAKIISETYGISESSVYRAFSYYYGSTPCAYLNKIKIERAKNLLSGTNLQIKFIASLLGYCSPNNFVINFKKACGKTPRQYRKENIS